MMMFNQMLENYELPPTIYTILKSLSYADDSEVVPKIKDLAKNNRESIFDFDYNLSEHISKEEFETMILNRFLMRRIGFDTVTAFKIALNVRLNEIMPNYNKLFDSCVNWKLFEDGEKEIREYTGDSSSSNTNKNISSSENDSNNNSTSGLIDHNHTTSNSTNKNRFSQTPQNQLQNVEQNAYLTNYNADNQSTDSTVDSTSNGTSQNVSHGTNSSESTTTNDVISKDTKYEIITKTPSDKLKIYKEFLETKQNIYTLIFNDLECLFFGLV